MPQLDVLTITGRGAWSSSRPWCARYGGEQPLFEQAGGGAVGIKVGTVDHQSVRRARLAREPCEDAVEDAKAAPADEAVVEGFVRALEQIAFRWQI